MTGLISSGPAALFGAKFCKSFVTPAVETVISGIGECGLGEGDSEVDAARSAVSCSLIFASALSRRGDLLVKTDWNCLFSTSALSGSVL